MKVVRLLSWVRPGTIRAEKAVRLGKLRLKVPRVP